MILVQPFAPGIVLWNKAIVSARIPIARFGEQTAGVRCRCAGDTVSLKVFYLDGGLGFLFYVDNYQAYQNWNPISIIPIRSMCRPPQARILLLYTIHRGTQGVRSAHLHSFLTDFGVVSINSDQNRKVNERGNHA